MDKRTRFESATMSDLVNTLLSRRDDAGRHARKLRDEATDVMSRRDVSDMLDQSNPSGDTDAATLLTLAQQADERLWEFQNALTRVAEGRYGFCVECGTDIPLERLRALPAAAACIECSKRLSHAVAAHDDRHRPSTPGSGSPPSTVRSSTRTGSHV